MNDNTMHGLPGSNNNARFVAAIQCASLYFLLGAADSENREVKHPDGGADHGQAARGAGRCSGMGAQRDRDQATGEAHGVGCGANQGTGVKA